jgi:hypothetical protein
VALSTGPEVASKDRAVVASVVEAGVPSAAASLPDPFCRELSDSPFRFELESPIDKPLSVGVTLSVEL